MFGQYDIELHLICSIVCCTFPCHDLLNRTGIILDCASCHVYVRVLYHVVCFFPVLLLLDSSSYVAIVRIHSSTPVHLLHGFSLPPNGISGKVTITLEITTILAFLVVLMRLLCRSTYHLFIKPPNMPRQASNLFCLPSKPLFGYVTALLSPSYSVARCRCIPRCSMLGHGYQWISQYLLFN